MKKHGIWWKKDFPGLVASWEAVRLIHGSWFLVFILGSLVSFLFNFGNLMFKSIKCLNFHVYMFICCCLMLS